MMKFFSFQDLQYLIIAFTAESLDAYTSLAPTSLEVVESIDMMRFLENKVSITAVFSSTNIIGVDLAEHISLVEKQFEDDKFIELYKAKYA
jgi:CMP-2-keto-3-deoxyoctulosonic acid synthetase